MSLHATQPHFFSGSDGSIGAYAIVASVHKNLSPFSAYHSTAETALYLTIGIIPITSNHVTILDKNRLTIANTLRADKLRHMTREKYINWENPGKDLTSSSLPSEFSPRG